MDRFVAPPSFTEYLSRLHVVRPVDPILKLGQDLGFRVTLYTPKPARWDLFNTCLQHTQLFQLGVAVLTYFAVRFQPGFGRSLSAMALVTFLIMWPAIYGKTGLGLVDFGLPAIGFLGSLHMIDIFFLRSREEVLSWSFPRFYCQLIAFPKEEQSDRPRWQNTKGLGLCILKLITVNLMLYGVPPPSMLDQIKSWPAFIGYNMAVGGCILQTLGFLIEGTFLLNGIVWGIEMQPMFNHPLAQTNLRAFWANWNLAIKDALHRVAFAAGKVQKKIKEETSKGSSGKQKPKPKFHHKDQLSETEAETEDDAPNGKANGEPKGKSSAQEQKVAAAKRKGVDVRPAPKAPDAKKGKKKGSGAFLKKAAAATFTFLVSGLFHEYMNHLAFGGATGENTAFFLCHAAGTIGYVWIGRVFPDLRDKTPTWVGVLFTDTFLFLTTPLFCMPFLRAGLFEDLKAAGIFGPVRGTIWVWGQ